MVTVVWDGEGALLGGGAQLRESPIGAYPRDVDSHWSESPHSHMGHRRERAGAAW